MSEHAEATKTEQPSAPAPDELDVVALQLVSLQHELHAMQGTVRAALLAVQMLLAKRGRAGATLPPLTRAGLGLTGQPDAAPGERPAPRTFMQGRPAAPEAAAAAPSTNNSEA